MYASKKGKSITCDEKVKELFADKKSLEEEIIQLRCDVVTLRVTAKDYLKAAVQYQCSPWDLRVVRAYGIAKTRMEEILSENAGDVARGANGSPSPADEKP
jgi:hypothetical protein